MSASGRKRTTILLRNCLQKPGRFNRAFDQAALVQFLSTPGVRATISVWVNSVRNQSGWEVTLPSTSPATPDLRQDAVRLAAALEVLRDINSAPDSELSQAICLLFQFRPRELSTQVRGYRRLMTFRPAMDSCQSLTK